MHCGHALQLSCFLCNIQLTDVIGTVWNRSPFLGLDRGRGYVAFITIMQNNIMYTPKVIYVFQPYKLYA